jgi:hypothetical protein
MYVRKSTKPRVVKMQSGEILTIADLPKAGLSRWTAARKSTVIRAVMFGLISTDEAIGRYELTHDEFQEWLRSYADYGRNGLKVIHKQPWVACITLLQVTLS